MYNKHYLSIICVLYTYVNCLVYGYTDYLYVDQEINEILNSNDQDLGVLPIDQTFKDVPRAFNPEINKLDIYNVICHNSKLINEAKKKCLNLEAEKQRDKILQKEKDGISFFNYYDNTFCCYYLNRTDIIYSEQCEISVWFFLYTGIIALIVLIVLAICIYNIRKKNEVLQEQKHLLQRSIKKQDDAETSHKVNNKYRHLEHTHEKQIPVRSNLPYQSDLKHDRENSNIYNSIDDLHIATRDPSPPPFNRIKAKKQYHWRISKREMDVLPKIPPREPIDMKPYIPIPEQALPPVTARQPISVPLEKPPTEKRLITTELTSVLSKRKMAENTVPNQNHIPSNPEKTNVPNALPMVKTIPSIPRTHPLQMPKTNPPMQKLATVSHTTSRRTPKQRVPTPPPSSHDPSENATSIYFSNETEDWNYEELKHYPIYTNK